MTNTKKYLEDLKCQLLENSNWHKVELTREWASKVPAKAGVYALKHNGMVVYAGETGNLRGRMQDLLDSRHHTVRRTIGKRLYSTYERFEQATSRKKFPPNIEQLLNDHISTNLTVVYIEVQLGRKELEELIIRDIPTDIRLNIRGKRTEK